MELHTATQQLQRSGPEHRRHADRFFQIKGIGWFVYIRDNIEIYDGIEVNAGVAGPFDTKAQARFFLLKHIYEDRPELFRIHERAS